MAPRTATDTREKLLNAAESMILARGYSATSVDQIIEKVGVTKGTFFYHFKTKNDLARALIDRYARFDEQLLGGNMSRAEKLSDDPLQQVLIFTGLMVEVAEQLDQSPEPGCLFAAYCYESGLFDAEINQVVAKAMLAWRDVLGGKLRAAAARRPPRLDVNLDSLADMLTGVLEGAFILSRTLGGSHIFAEQMRHYRNYLQLLFEA